jgi:aminopeptidase N
MNPLNCHSPRILALAAVGVLLATAASTSIARAHDDCCQSFKMEAFEGYDATFAGFDAVTGRNTRNYPPDRHADHTHLKIEITVPTMDEPRLTGRETLTFRPIARDLSSLTLDARAMIIKNVAAPGHKVTFGHDGMVLSIALDPPATIGQESQVVIEYELHDPPEGLLWTALNPTKPTRTPQIHTQGQAESNSYWFPCRDFPNERTTTEIIANVPEGFMVSSNGRLLKHAQVSQPTSPNAPQSKREVWHWLQDKDHVAYLVSMVIGKFDIVDVGTPSLPMPVYVPPGRSIDVVGTYGRTSEMVAAFEALLDEKYPWDRYAQLVVTNFNSGGMENTSATSMHDAAIIDADNLDDFEIEGLIAHELAHQWFGDLITCNSWEHLWLNEGFATYFTGIWAEQRVPAKGEAPWTGGPLAYERSVLGWYDSVIGADTVIAPAGVGFSSNAYAHPGEVFGRPANPYGKGASTLNMLRRKLGDENFFKGLALYVDRFKFKTVETHDLRRVMEEVSGESLEHFFWQWCTRPGIPRVKFETQWDSSASVLRVNGSQTQAIDGDNPAFEFTIPIVARLNDGSESVGTLTFKGKDASLDLPCNTEPAFVEFDPRATTLLSMDLRLQSPEALRDQALKGSTLYTRVQAIRASSNPDGAKYPDTIGEIARNAAEPTFLRLEAFRVATLASRPRGALSFMNADRWELREAACSRLGEFGLDRWTKADAMLQDQVRRALIRAAETDASLKVRAAAIRAMGILKDPAFEPIIAKAFDTDSHADTLRQAAIDAAVSWDSKDMLRRVEMLTGLTHFARTRGAATDAVVKLAKHEPNEVLALLGKLAKDRIARVQRTAGDGLVRLGLPGGVAKFDEAIAAERAAATRRQLERWQGQLEKDLAAKAAAPKPQPKPNSERTK